MTAYQELAAFQRDTEALAQIAGRLGWDQETMMPRGAADQRGDHADQDDKGYDLFEAHRSPRLTRDHARRQSQTAPERGLSGRVREGARSVSDRRRGEPLFHRSPPRRG